MSRNVHISVRKSLRTIEKQSCEIEDRTMFLKQFSSVVLFLVHFPTVRPVDTLIQCFNSGLFFVSLLKTLDSF